MKKRTVVFGAAVLNYMGDLAMRKENKACRIMAFVSAVIVCASMVGCGTDDIDDTAANATSDTEISSAVESDESAADTQTSQTETTTKISDSVTNGKETSSAAESKQKEKETGSASKTVTSSAKKENNEFSHRSDPNADSDNDGLTNEDEAVLGTDPNKKDTDGDGTPDNKEYIKQKVKKSTIDADLFEDNFAIPSAITVNAQGNVNRNMSVSEYNGYLKGDERSYVGKVIEISNAKIKSGKIQFTLSEDYTIQNYEVAGQSSNGLLICFHDGENTTPLETKFNEKKRTLTADISSEGIYFVLDVMDWMYSLGIDPNDPQYIKGAE